MLRFGGAAAIDNPTTRTVIIVMGVTGCGKSTVGRALAEGLGVPFYDGDDFHSPASINKMRQGVALNDEDRWPWLDRLRELAAAKLQAREGAVIACSALRATYRERLRPQDSGLGAMVWFAYLRISPELARQRVVSRPDHYMPASLLDSQFAALEEPGASERTRTFDAGLPIDELVPLIIEANRTIRR